MTPDNQNETRDAIRLVEQIAAGLDSKNRKQRDKLTVRERLILAAIDEIEEVGFARFSLRHVAEVCGVSCAAPYKHFRNKRELINAILLFINAEWDRRQTDVLERFKDASTRVKLVELALEFIRFMVENQQFRSILMIHDETFDSDYLQIKSGLSARSKKLLLEYCQEVGMPEQVAKIKMYVTRSLLYGASLMLGNCELKYDDATMGFVRATIDREFDLPWQGYPAKLGTASLSPQPLPGENSKETSASEKNKKDANKDAREKQDECPGEKNVEVKNTKNKPSRKK